MFDFLKTDTFDLYTFGQIFGIVISFIGFFVYFGKKRSTLLASKLSLDVGYFFQQIMIGAYTGAALNLVATFREVVFYNRGKHRWASHRVWLYIFILLTLISPVLTWLGPVSLLPAIGSVLSVISFYCMNTHHMRIFGLFAQSLWLTYNILMMNIGLLISTAVQLVAVIVGLIRDYVDMRKSKRDANNQGMEA